MKKRASILAFFLTVFGLVLSGQNHVFYYAKSRLRGSVRKYQSSQLVLRNDSTYYFEEIFGGLPGIVEYGNYCWRRDTLLLNTRRGDILKYIKDSKYLIPQNDIFQKLVMKRGKLKLP